jgi:hypothetical protein
MKIKKKGRKESESRRSTTMSTINYVPKLLDEASLIVTA